MSATSQVSFRLKPASLASALNGWAFYLFCLVGIGAFAGLLLAPKFLLPAEDAVILFQFSRNLAHTGAITFVAYGPHTEGATDFAWMVILSLAIKLGIEPFWFVAVANVVSMAVLAGVLLHLAGQRVKPLPLLFVVGAFTLTAQYFAALVGFSSLPFACLLALLVLAYVRRSDTALPAMALVFCLFRPDGVIFAIPLLLSALIVNPVGRLPRLALDLLLFALPGLCYFLWRWHYFGEFLPLPFLVKADAQRVAHLFVFESLKAGVHYLLFSGLLLAYALRRHMRERDNWPLLLCLILLPNVFYFAMRLDQDIGDRFFVYMPVGTAILLALNWRHVQSKASLLWVGLALWAVFILGPFRYQEGILERYQHDNRVAIAKDLGALPRGTLIATEAGILPYYSQWNAYDAWGLNTAEFAKRLFQPSDVDKLRPDLMLVYTGGDSACFPQRGWHTPYQARTWEDLTRNMVVGADAASFDLWLVPFGSSSWRARHALSAHEGDQECWFLRTDSPLYARIKDVLGRHHGIPESEYKALGYLRDQGTNGPRWTKRP
jgi:hypothetical protein